LSHERKRERERTCSMKKLGGRTPKVYSKQPVNGRQDLENGGREGADTIDPEPDATQKVRKGKKIRKKNSPAILAADKDRSHRASKRGFPTFVRGEDKVKKGRLGEGKVHQVGASHGTKHSEKTTSGKRKEKEQENRLSHAQTRGENKKESFQRKAVPLDGKTRIKKRSKKRGRKKKRKVLNVGPPP